MSSFLLNLARRGAGLALPVVLPSAQESLAELEVEEGMAAEQMINTEEVRREPFLPNTVVNAEDDQVAGTKTPYNLPIPNDQFTLNQEFVADTSINSIGNRYITISDLRDTFYPAPTSSTAPPLVEANSQSLYPQSPFIAMEDREVYPSTITANREGVLEQSTDTSSITIEENLEKEVEKEDSTLTLSAGVMSNIVPRESTPATEISPVITPSLMGEFEPASLSTTQVVAEDVITERENMPNRSPERKNNSTLMLSRPLNRVSSEKVILERSSYSVADEESNGESVQTENSLTNIAAAEELMIAGNWKADEEALVTVMDNLSTPLISKIVKLPEVWEREIPAMSIEQGKEENYISNLFNQEIGFSPKEKSEVVLQSSPLPTGRLTIVPSSTPLATALESQAASTESTTPQISVQIGRIEIRTNNPTPLPTLPTPVRSVSNRVNHFDRYKLTRRYLDRNRY